MNTAGVMRGGAELKPAEAATVRFKNGKPGPKLDGPFAETKEQLGGYSLIETDTLQAAIEWAGKMPGIANGAVEVPAARIGS